MCSCVYYTYVLMHDSPGHSGCNNCMFAADQALPSRQSISHRAATRLKEKHTLATSYRWAARLTECCAVTQTAETANPGSGA